MILTPNGFYKYLRVPLSWHSLPLHYLSTLDMDERSLFYTGHLLWRRTLLSIPSAFLWPSSHLAKCHSSSMKLSVWSSCFQNLSPACRQNLSVEKVKRKRVNYHGWSCVLLKQPWQGGRLTHFLLWGFGWFCPLGRLLFFLLDRGTFSSFRPCTRSPYLLG